MGKAKKRSLALGKYNKVSNLSREDAISLVIERFRKMEDVSDIITLFGLKAEELLEAGASYEEVKSVEGILR